MLLTKISPKRLIGVFILGLLVAIAPTAIATAACTANAQSCSNSYQVTESFFGNGGAYSCSSGQYCARQSSGETTVGKVCDAGDQKCLEAGFNTDRTPYIEMAIDTPGVDVGVVDATRTNVGQASFRIKTYLAQGYQVITAATPPSIPSHTFATPGLSAPTPGTERFGINLVANSCPSPGVSVPDPGSCTGGFGADPVCDPADFCNLPDGDVTIDANYATADQFYYPTSGSDTLISSTSSTGFTTFTISYIFNASNTTPAGTYTMAHDLVATSTF